MYLSRITRDNAIVIMIVPINVVPQSAEMKQTRNLVHKDGGVE